MDLVSKIPDILFKEGWDELWEESCLIYYADNYIILSLLYQYISANLIDIRFIYLKLSF